MSALKHNGKVIQETSETYQTQSRGSNGAEYDIYMACADNGSGGDITRNGLPLKTFEEWLNS